MTGVPAGAGGFVALGVKEAPVHCVERTKVRAGYRIYRAADGFEAAIPESVLERCMHFGRAAEPNEWFGLVVAKLCADNQGRHLVVLGVVPDPDAKATPVTVNTTVTSEFRTRALARMLYPDGCIVGWAHGHLGCGAFFSPTDLATQRSWKESHSLSFVVDPWSDEAIAVFRGPGSERLALAEGAVEESAVACDTPHAWAVNFIAARSRVSSAYTRAEAWIRKRGMQLLAALFAIGLGYLGCGVAAVNERVSRLEESENAIAEGVAPSLDAGAVLVTFGECLAVDGGMLAAPSGGTDGAFPDARPSPQEDAGNAP